MSFFLGLFPLLLLHVGAVDAAVGPGEIAAVVRSETAKVIRHPESDIEVIFSGIKDDLDCPTGSSIRVELISKDAQIRTHVEANVVVGDEGRPCTRIRVRARVRVWEEVPVATRNTPTGTQVQMRLGRLTRDKIDGTPLSLASIGSKDYVARVSLKSGEVVLANRVRPRPLVLAGDPVDLFATVGRLTVKAPGRLLQDGSAGERVQVLNMATKATLEGILEADGTVTVIAGRPIIASNDVGKSKGER